MPHKSRLGAIVIDCKCDDLAEHSAFWCKALGLAPASDQPDPEKYVGLAVPGDEVSVILQKVDHDSRVHIDIETDDKDAEVARLEKLGARKVAAIKTWIVMEAPSGHRFCIVNPQRREFAGAAKNWDSA